MKFYQLLPPENDPEGDGVAWALDISDPLYHPRDAVAQGITHQFELRDMPFSDFLMTDVGWSLCSPALKSILERSANQSDGLRWCPVLVSRQEDARAYHAIYFDDCADVLNKGDTIYAGDFVVRPSFRADEALKQHVLTVDDPQLHGRIYVTRNVVDEVKKAGLKGVALSPVRTK